MKQILSVLLVFLLITPVFLVVTPQLVKEDRILAKDPFPDFNALEQEFGDTIPMVVSFDFEIDESKLRILDEIGIAFSLGSPDASRIGSYYLIQGNVDALESLSNLIPVEFLGPQTKADHSYAARDVSIPEINASLVWQTLDDLGRNVTGEGILIADLDSGVDWTHPDLWFANGSSYSWIDSVVDFAPTNGSDFIDLDSSSTGTPNETLYYLDFDGSSTFNVSTEWIWADNVSLNGVPNIGEPFFVVNDTNHDDLLNTGENLIMLNKPKTRYIVEKVASTLQVWDRNTNLTASTHEDTDGHGTAVSGILLGGQVGYRKYVGAAPDAELMMIKVLGP
ncbi:MAG: S8 family serine peptidase, partial [Candidatus Thorarchaeota archaeon]|nr:S8 family serine peptidase [Candidatus Thorarchaeota archaeon]